MSEPLRLEAADGTSLEAELDGEGGAGAFVLCHPHPKMGGTMNAPLLLALRDRLVAEGWSVLRFNFRGIGMSGGEPSTGEAEVADVRGAVRAAREHFGTPSIALGGWSFGGAVAARAAAAGEDVDALVLVAPAQAKAGVSAGLPPPDEVPPDLHVLVVCGSNDEQVSPEACRSWAEQVPNARYQEIRGANHFFWAKYAELGEAVGRFLGSQAGKEKT